MVLEPDKLLLFLFLLQVDIILNLSKLSMHIIELINDRLDFIILLAQLHFQLFDPWIQIIIHVLFFRF